MIKCGELLSRLAELPVGDRTSIVVPTAKDARAREVDASGACGRLKSRLASARRRRWMIDSLITPLLHPLQSASDHSFIMDFAPTVAAPPSKVPVESQPAQVHFLIGFRDLIFLLLCPISTLNNNRRRIFVLAPISTGSCSD